MKRDEIFRDHDDPNLLTVEPDQAESRRFGSWTSGYFWWARSDSPAYVTLEVGVAGDICFPLFVQWPDSDYYRSYVIRYDRARLKLELVRVPDGEFGSRWEVEDEFVSDFETIIDWYEFQPDILFSYIAECLGDIKLMEPVQSQFLSSSNRVDAPEPEHVWRPVDTESGTDTPAFVTDEETPIGNLIASARRGED